MSITDGLVAALQLDASDQITLGDPVVFTSQPTVQGAVVVSDPKFGRALQISGNNQSVAVEHHPLMNIGGDLSLALWISLAEPLTTWTRVVGKGRETAGVETFGLWVNAATNTWWFQQLGPSPVFVHSAADPISANVWYHLTAVRAGDTVTLYLNGVQQIAQLTSVSGAPTMNTEPLILGYNGEYNPFNGRIAHLRLYNRALTESDRIAVLAASGVGVLPPAVERPAPEPSPTPAPPAPSPSPVPDGGASSATAAFRRSHPIDFSLFDGDHHYTLAIDDGSAGQPLILEMQNASGAGLSLLAGTDQLATEQNYHFELRFRPGTLSDNTLALLRDPQARARILAGAPDWSLYASPLQSPGAQLSLFLLYTGSALLWPPGDTRSVTLSGLSAAAAGGARGTRVELRTSQISYSGDTVPLSGGRTRHLSIVNRTGQKRIPLHMGFVGPNRVLNDGSAHTFNTLRLRITNIARRDTPALDLSNQARLTLLVETGERSKEWALATPDEAKAIQVTVRRPDGSWADVALADGGQVPVPEWAIAGALLPAAQLAPGEQIEIALANIATLHPNGSANVYLRYQNITGYWDGELVATIKKAPLLYADQFVGIGVDKPLAPLHVKGEVRVEGQLTVDRQIAIGTTTPQAALDLQSRGDAPGQRLLFRLQGPMDFAGKGVEFLNADGSYGLGFGSNTIYAAGSAPQYLQLDPKAGGRVVVAGTLQLGADGRQALYGEGGGLVLGATRVAGDLRVEGNIYKKALNWWYLQLVEPVQGGRQSPLIISTGTSWMIESDERLKHEVRLIDGALEKLARLRGVSFEWSELGLRHLTRAIERRVSAGPGATDEEHQRAREAARQEAYAALAGSNIGLLAQDVEQVLPELVGADEEGYKLVRYDLLVALLVEAVKELSARVDRLAGARAAEGGTR